MYAAIAYGNDKILHLMDVFHDVTEKKTKRTLKKDIQNYIVWNMCFKRLVLTFFSLSVALNKNGKLLNLVETAWLRLSIGINYSF